jgi:hypothetical protein
MILLRQVHRNVHGRVHVCGFSTATTHWTVFGIGVKRSTSRSVAPSPDTRSNHEHNDRTPPPAGELRVGMARALTSFQLSVLIQAAADSRLLIAES